MHAKSIQTYAQNLQQHHGNQMPNKPMPGPNAPQGQGSPMVASGPDGTQLNAFYNAQEPMGAAPNGGMRPGVPATQNGSNHALQDYQMQLMLLEQQNKKRLMMARQEQDGIQGQGMARADGPGGPGPAGGPGGPAGAPNGPQFQGASPQGARPGASPNPSEQMKRAAGQMNNGSMGSPLPEGAQNRESPNNPMNFMGTNMDPNGAPHFFKGINNGMDANMAAAQMNGGMNRPPSSHPGQQPFSQMNPQQQAMMRQQQMQQQQQGGPNGQPMPGQWQGGPNGQMPGGPQGGPQQGPVHGTPQQRAMPPPSAPTAAANSNANQRNTTASPQVSNAAPPTPSQANKAAPKKKDTKAKDKVSIPTFQLPLSTRPQFAPSSQNNHSKQRAATQKKSNANLNAAGGATPAADGGNDGEAPTPATPMTPMAASQQNFNKPGPAAGGAPPQQMPNGQPPAAAPTAAPVAPQQHNDPNQFNMEGGGMVSCTLDNTCAVPESQADIYDFPRTSTWTSLTHWPRATYLTISTLTLSCTITWKTPDSASTAPASTSRAPTKLAPTRKPQFVLHVVCRANGAVYQSTFDQSLQISSYPFYYSSRLISLLATHGVALSLISGVSLGSSFWILYSCFFYLFLFLA